ncbi:MAG: redoxin domain-containing protein [Planctomycetes bacterium]|nr:redoxin domain-containing protein [Planctomycetota bacterium]
MPFKLESLTSFPSWSLSAKPEAGKPAPDFALKDQDGKEVKLSSLKGKKNVLLAFYPKDFTGG